MADLTVNSPDRAANAITIESAAAGGDAFLNTGLELLSVRHTNAGGSAVDLTIVTQKTIDGEDVADKVITIPAGEEHLIGPFPYSIYNDADRKVHISYSAVTDIEVAVIRPKLN